ncbi:MAG: cyclic nucleotide-binding domain-containing protein [Candidatus Methylacidiphilales bacterium]|nr:cyclic nucleotide-binding domain-containing protein [Candidatus Methylacidiphilales bacterium]
MSSPSAYPRSEFFGFFNRLESLKQREMMRLWKPMKFHKGEFVYHQGAEADAIYIVDRGVVEVVTSSPDGKQSRSLSYLTRGDVFGEIGVLTSNVRVAGIVTCEEVELMKISKQDFIFLMGRIPQLGAFMASYLAERLYETTERATFNSYSVDFGGSLLRFDMLLIFQTIISSGQTGELRLINPHNDLIGSFFFTGGGVTNGRFAHLQGIEAVWQIFLEPSFEGTFAFQIRDRPSLPFDDAFRITMDGMGLLMEAASMRDTFMALPQRLQRMEGRLVRLVMDLEWQDANSYKLIDRIWKLVERRPQVLSSIWRRLDICSLTLIQLVQGLIRTHQAELNYDEQAQQFTGIPQHASR